MSTDLDVSRGVVLVVHDEPEIRTSVVQALLDEGYPVVLAEGLQKYIDCLRDIAPRLVLIKAAFAYSKAFEKSESDRRNWRIPALVLASSSADRDLAFGSEHPPSDIMQTPISLIELLVRVREILKREAQDRRSSSIKIREIEVDEAGHEVYVRGQCVSLAPKEFALLTFLVRNPDLALSRETLFKKIWNENPTDMARTIDVHIACIRRKIEVDPARPSYIQTIRGHGYKLKSQPS